MFKSKSTLGYTTPLCEYQGLLEFLGACGKTNLPRSKRPPVVLPREFSALLNKVDGLKNLFLSFGAVAPGVPGTRDEEWNPLSQRPHSVIPPNVTESELGAELIALKESLDAFSILTHEMMHIALWEPFFVGRWRPQSQETFCNFSVMAEGFCFFFSDIIVSAAVQQRLPDGEFAFARRTPSQALFNPVRAFDALNIKDPKQILKIYLAGFSGKNTPLSQSRLKNEFSSALAKQLVDFYADSRSYLGELYGALTHIGCFAAFYERFCSVPGLPSILPTIDSLSLNLSNSSGKMGEYFSSFFGKGLEHLGSLTRPQILRVRWRRMIQMRAYYALQVSWILQNKLVTGDLLRSAKRVEITKKVELYLFRLEKLIQDLVLFPNKSPLAKLGQIDKYYDQEIRAIFLQENTWVGFRWLIAPRRAGGYISAGTYNTLDERQTKVDLLKKIAFLVDELNWQVRESKTIEERSSILAHVAVLANLGAKAGTTLKSSHLEKKLKVELVKPYLLPIWSVQLADFDPCKNLFRELAFSYQ